MLLGGIDLFFVWLIVNLAIGIGVLYKKRTAPIALTMMGIYVSLVLVVRRRSIGAFRSLVPMTTGKKILIALGILLVGAAVVAANLWFGRDAALAVTTEAIKARDLEAIVSASGKIQPKRLVQIAAETSGRVVDLAVNEGDRITKGQFLLQIDPRLLRTRVDSGTASLSAAEASLEQQRQSIQTSRVQLDQAQKNLARQQELWKQAAHDARGARARGERRPLRGVGASRSASGRSTRRKRASARSAPASRAPATT